MAALFASGVVPSHQGQELDWAVAVTAGVPGAGSGAASRGGGKRYTRPNVRGVRGARKLDIILDEEEDADDCQDSESRNNETEPIMDIA